MTPALSRRDALRVGVASVTMLAGCSGSDDGDDDGATPHPDEGTDSYGVRVENRAPEDYEPKRHGDPDNLTYEIDLKVVYPWSDEEPPWEKSVTLDPGESTAWESVVTGEREQVLSAKLPGGGVHEHCERVAATYWITPGSENAPDVRYLDVIVDYTYARSRHKEETDPSEVVKDHVMYIDHDELTHEWEEEGEDGPFAWNHC